MNQKKKKKTNLNVFDIINAAQPRKTNEAQWTSTPKCFKGPTNPHRTPFFPTPSIKPLLTHSAINPQRNKELGIGKPSKYLAFPETSWGTNATVALNLANLAIPAQMKVVRIKVSVVVLNPTQNAATAGATPNEIYITSMNHFIS